MTIYKPIAAMVLMLVIATSPAEAGVKGGKFEGSVINSYGTMVPLENSFFSNGSVTQTEFGSSTFSGTFSETGFFVSEWQGTIYDGSPDGVATIAGTCWFGTVTTFYELNTDVNITDWGLLFRTGSAASTQSLAPNVTAVSGAAK